MPTKYLAISADAKTRKGETGGYLTGILYLAPGNLSGREFCPDRTPGCTADCLFTAGRGVTAPVYAGRMRKSLEFTANPKDFVTMLKHDIHALLRKAEREGLTPLVRLNGTSDLPWENITDIYGCSLMACFPGVQFYDYTKSSVRMKSFLSRAAYGNFPPNYHLTFSRSESNHEHVMACLKLGGNVAIVFSTRKHNVLPAWWYEYPVMDGDLNDVRHTGAQGVVIGLRAKGKARRSHSGFVVEV